MQEQARTSELRWISVADRLPAPGQFVRYRAKTFSTAGYCDTQGNWTDSKGRPEQAEVLEWLESGI
jgi:hypothetical protein